MPMIANKAMQTFNDGWMEVCEVKNNQITGTKSPAPIRYGEETVGATRFWQAAVAEVNISRKVHVPLNPWIAQDDIVILDDGNQYRIRQIQRSDYTMPVSYSLSLEKLNILKKDVREGD